MRGLLLSMLIPVIFLGFAQRKMTSEGEERVRISILEKQNKVAKDIPKMLLQAWCNGDIEAYYPKDMKVKMTYAQFLEHFGMEEKAYHLIDHNYPAWYCGNESLKCIPIDDLTLSCLQYEIELGEENFFNQQKSIREKRIDYVKLIYSSRCTFQGIEVEGPVFMMKDIKKLNKEQYKVRNMQNDAASFPIWSYLTLGSFNTTTIYKKNEFVENPASLSREEIQKGVAKENDNWEK